MLVPEVSAHSTRKLLGKGWQEVSIQSPEVSIGYKNLVGAVPALCEYTLMGLLLIPKVVPLRIAQGLPRRDLPGLPVYINTVEQPLLGHLDERFSASGSSSYSMAL